jgi:hypothetical protein
MRDVNPADLGAAIYDLLETIRGVRPRFESEARQRALEFNQFVARSIAGMLLDRFHVQRVWHALKAGER